MPFVLLWPKIISLDRRDYDPRALQNDRGGTSGVRFAQIENETA
jgi:hypothetical protein